MYEVITVYTRTVWMAVLPVAAMMSISAWGQASPGNGGHTGGPNGPATLPAPSDDNSVAGTTSPSKIAALKKQAAKESRKNAAAAAKAASSAPPK
jgi:hypothetical protein